MGPQSGLDHTPRLQMRYLAFGLPATGHLGELGADEARRDRSDGHARAAQFLSERLRGVGRWQWRATSNVHRAATPVRVGYDHTEHTPTKAQSVSSGTTDRRFECHRADVRDAGGPAVSAGAGGAELADQLGLGGVQVGG
jgi:hypothetical protein